MAMVRIDRGRGRLIATGLAAVLLSSLTAMYAGFSLAEGRNLLAVTPGLMVLVPPALNMRGSIAGVMTSRLSSSMHLGEFETSFHTGSVLWVNIWASFGLTVIVGCFIGIVSYASCFLFGLPVIDLIPLTQISLSTAIISGILIMAFSVGLSLLTYRLGLDLDMIAAPIVTTAGDIITVPVLLLVAEWITGLSGMVRGILFAGTLISCTALILLAVRRSQEVRKIESQSLVVLLPLVILPTLAGVSYSFDLDVLIAYAAILTLIPPFADGCGNIGGILCSRLSTLMHTGQIDPEILPSRGVMPEFGTAYLYTVILLPLTGAVVHLISQACSLSSPGLVTMIAITTIAGLILMTFIIGVSYLIAALSFRYGYDPDNYGIPVVTCFIDLTGAVILVWVIQMML
ncbi:MAG: magnesium transporter [Methanoculleaceae archaeon]